MSKKKEYDISGYIGADTSDGYMPNNSTAAELSQKMRNIVERLDGSFTKKPFETTEEQTTPGLTYHFVKASVKIDPEKIDQLAGLSPRETGNLSIMPQGDLNRIEYHARPRPSA